MTKTESNPAYAPLWIAVRELKGYALQAESFAIREVASSCEVSIVSADGCFCLQKRSMGHDHKDAGARSCKCGRVGAGAKPTDPGC